MKTEFFEQYPTMRDLSAYLKSKPETAKMTAAQYISANLPKESVFQTDIIKAVKGWIKERHISPSSFIWKQNAGVYNRNGLPDLMMICDGQFFGFEVKRPYIGKPSFLQEKTIKDINAAGGHAAIVSYHSEVMALLKQHGVWRNAG
jgi:hypothetical protein